MAGNLDSLTRRPSASSAEPVATVRAGTSPEGLPIGVQLIGGPWRDDVALAAAAAVEGASGGWKPPPHHSFYNRINRKA